MVINAVKIRCFIVVIYRCRATPLPHLEVKEIKHLRGISEKCPFQRLVDRGLKMMQLATFDTLAPLRLHDGTLVTPSTSVPNLGVIFDNELLLVNHVNSVTRSCFYVVL